MLGALAAAALAFGAGPAVSAAAGPAGRGPVAIRLLASGPGARPAFGEWATPAFSAATPIPGAAVISVDDQHVRQPVLGVGGALTNSAAWLLEQGLGPSARAAAIGDLFGAGGAHMSVVRIGIGGSDFNVGGRRYSEDDMPPGQTDPGLRHFGLAHDADTIAVLRAARRDNPGLKVIASPWSAPAWMKTNDSLADRGFGGRLRARDYRVYAAYFVRFLQGYARAGVPIWAITVQNEPFGVPATYEGMLLSAAQEIRFVRDDLRPALDRARLHPLILGVDNSWNGGQAYAESEERARAFDGLAWHCYYGNPDVVMAHFPRALQVLSECAPNLIASPATAVVANMFNDGAQAALLWTLASDPAGGPVVPPNQTCGGCRGVVIVNPVSHTVARQADFDALAQFGRALAPGARRIAATRLGRWDPTYGSHHATIGLHDVAFRNPDGDDVLVVFNNGGHQTTCAVRWRGLVYQARVPAGWTVTLTWPAA